MQFHLGEVVCHPEDRIEGGADGGVGGFQHVGHGADSLDHGLDGLEGGERSLLGHFHKLVLAAACQGWQAAIT